MGGVTIKTAYFDGPIGTLLFLIEKQKLSIDEVSLVQVTDSFLALVSEMGDVDPDKATHFLQVAATLLLIKSKALLPNIVLEEEDEQTIDLLEERLRLFQAFSKYSRVVNTRFGKVVLPVSGYRSKRKVEFSPNETLKDIYQYKSILGELLEALPAEMRRPEVQVRQSIDLGDILSNLQARIKEGSVSLAGMISSTLKPAMPERDRKIALVVVFLAMLESVRDGSMNIFQDSLFGDITLESNIEKYV